MSSSSSGRLGGDGLLTPSSSFSSSSLSSSLIERHEWSPMEDHKARYCSERCCCIGMIVLALFLFLSAAFLPLELDRLLAKGVRDSLLVDSVNSVNYEHFKDSKLSGDGVLVNVYVYDITNPEEILKGSKPSVVELGPFVYELEMEKFNISWAENGEIIRYKTYTNYKFRADKSVSDDNSTMITSPNMLYLSLYYTVAQKLPISMRSLFMNHFYSTRSKSEESLLFHRVSVRDILFGYNDANFKAHKEGKFDFPGLITNTSKAFQPVDLHEISQHTGKYIPELLGSVSAIDRKDHIEICKSVLGCKKKEPLWKTNKANEVGGSSGTYFEIEKVQALEPLDIWIGGLNLKAKLVPSMESEHLYKKIDGIKTLRYKLDPEVFRNQSNSAENDPFYHYGPNGLLNLSQVAFGVPLTASKPHFLDGDENLHLAIKNLKQPSKEDDDFLVYVDKIIGIPIKMSQRFQTNIFLQPLDIGVNLLGGKVDTIFENIQPLHMPMIWMETVESLSSQHKRMIQNCDLAKKILDYGHIIAYIIGSIIALFAIQKSVVHGKKVEELKIKRRRSHLYQALLQETGDDRPHYTNMYIDRQNIFKHKHFRRALLTSATITFTINMSIELLALKNVSEIGIFQPLGTGEPFAISRLSWATFLVAFFTSLGATKDAIRSVSLGDFPAVQWEALDSWKLLRRNNNNNNGIMDDEWGNKESGCQLIKKDFWLIFLLPSLYMERPLLISLTSACWYCIIFLSLGALLSTLLVFASNISSLPVIVFAFAKASFATCEAICVFIPHYMSAASVNSKTLNNFLKVILEGEEEQQHQQVDESEHIITITQ